MRQLFVLLLLVVIVLVPAVVQAAPDRQAAACTDYQAPSSGCTAAFSTGQTLRVKELVPFIWLRAFPQSPIILTTVYPGGSASMQVYTDPNYQVSTFDGYQWWWLVATYPDRRVLGWVEQSSLRDATIAPPPTDPTQVANWTTPLNGQVVPGVPFLWVRSTPSSVGQVVATIPGNGTLMILGAPQFDGVQWWWFVQYGFSAGYVEQTRIMPR